MVRILFQVAPNVCLAMPVFGSMTNDEGLSVTLQWMGKVINNTGIDTLEPKSLAG